MKWQYEHTALTIAAAANFSQLGARLIISPTIPRIIDEFGVSKAEVGLVLTGMWMIYALGQFPSGVLSDRIGERPLVIVALGFTVLASLLLAVAPSFVLFGVFVLLLGAGTGLFFAVASSLIAKLFDNTGQALGFLSASGALAGMTFPILGAYVAIWYGWRGAFVAAAVIALPVFVVATLRLRPTTADGSGESLRDHVDVSVLSDLLSRPGLVYTLVLASILGFVWQAITSFFPTFLVEFHGFTIAQAGIAFGVIFLLSALTQPVLGRASDIFSRDGAIGACVLVAAIGFGLVLFGTTTVLTLVGIGLLGFGISWNGVLQARFMDHLSDDERGTGFGLSRTIYMMVSALGSVVAGTLAAVAGWTVAFGLMAVLLCGALCVLIGNWAFGLGL